MEGEAFAQGMGLSSSDLVFRRWGESFGSSVKEEDTDWDFPNMEEISLQGGKKLERNSGNIFSCNGSCCI